MSNLFLCSLNDSHGKIISLIPHPSKPVLSSIDKSRFAAIAPDFTFFKNELVLYYVIDTIYKIKKDSIVPGFILNWGKIPHKKDPVELYCIQPVSSDNARRSGKFFETSENAFFAVREMDDCYLLKYDKHSGMTTSMSSKINDFGFINDLDGGRNFFPKWTNRSGDIWIDCIDAFDFNKMHSDELLLNANAEGYAGRDYLKSFLSSLEEDDNPVLRLVYLKNR